MPTFKIEIWGTRLYLGLNTYRELDAAIWDGWLINVVWKESLSMFSLWPGRDKGEPSFQAEEWLFDVTI